MKIALSVGGKIDRFEGSKVRIEFEDHPGNSILIQELPTKPVKRKLSRAQVNFYYIVSVDHLNEFLVSNIKQDMKLKKGMSYKEAVNELKKAMEIAKKAALENSRYNIDESHFDKVYRWKRLLNEDTIFYLEVPPSNTKPFIAKGKDFQVSLEWNRWSSYSPGSDLQSMDPNYTQYESSSKAAARKLFNLLRAKPDALKNLTWDKFGGWLDRQKIKYRTNFSVWH